MESLWLYPFIQTLSKVFTSIKAFPDPSGSKQHIYGVSICKLVWCQPDTNLAIKETALQHSYGSSIKKSHKTTYRYICPGTTLTGLCMAVPKKRQKRHLLDNLRKMKATNSLS